MQAEYKRDLTHNYLILPGQDLDTSSYKIRMLVGNAVPLLLKCRIQAIDGEFYIYYEITSRQSVGSLFEGRKLTIEELQILFSGFIQVMEQMSEYLLNPCDLVLIPEFIFMEAEKRELSFCYLPGYGKDVREQFQTLTEYILPRLDHEDGKAVMLGYGIYRRALEDTFHLEHVKEELYRVQEGGSETAERPPEMAGEAEEAKEPFQFPGEEELLQELSGGKTDSGKEAGKKKQYGHLAALLLAALLLFAVAAANYMGYLPRMEIELLMGMVVAAAGAGLFLVFVIQKKKKQSDEGGRGNQTLPFEEQPEVGKKYAEAEERSEGMSQASAVMERPLDCGETVVLSANESAGPAMLVSREPGELATIYLQKEVTVIGKLETAADVVIFCPTVSRIHAKIRCREGEYYLTDLNSRNGTSVNGMIIKNGEDYCLQNEDEVDFAQARYIFLK